MFILKKIRIRFLAIFFQPNKVRGKFYTNEFGHTIHELLHWLAFRVIFTNGVRKLIE